MAGYQQAEKGGSSGERVQPESEERAEDQREASRW